MRSTVICAQKYILTLPILNITFVFRVRWRLGDFINNVLAKINCSITAGPYYNYSLID